jgi:glycosyltransferase involved in cell wall biosynthesis
MNRFAAAHQFHPGSAEGDAITQQMLSLQHHLRQLGYESEIFGEHIGAGLQDRIRPISGYQGSEKNLLFFHHSLGSDLFDDVVGLPDEIVAVYHNLTPEEYFSDEWFRRLIRLGHDQLALLARRARVGIAASNYNRREMLGVGFRRVEVLPPRVDYSQFASTAAEDEFRSTDWLFVGRLVRNKCQHELVRAFAAYTKTFDDDARLLLIGHTFQTDYLALIREEASRSGVGDRIISLGPVSEHRLKSAFAGAGVFVSMSEHEGFGVPILEAMAAGLPVVAYGAAAIPETMGGAGVLLRDKDPKVVAAVVQSLREDPLFRERLVTRQHARVARVQALDVRAVLDRVLGRATGHDRPLEVQIQGPFETNYSLAVLNRKLASGLSELPDRAVSIYATEGPGDYEPSQRDLTKHPQAAEFLARSRHVPYPDVVVRQMYPPRVIDSPGGITCQYFAWEESRVPQSMVDDFNRYLDGVGVTSTFVRDVLRDSGVDVPIRVVGDGVDPPDPTASITAPELERLRKFRFVHISSGFPRKGLDVLLEAYFSAFDGSDDVTLVVKTFPNPHNEVGKLLYTMRSQHPNPPDVRLIDRDLEDADLQGLFNLAHCYVHPARGEGFGLPVAEAMAAGVPVITLAYSGLADFVSEQTALTIPFELERSKSHLGVADSFWAEPDREQLAAAMRRLAESPDDQDVGYRVQRARDVITERFSWQAVSMRWDEFITDLEEAAETPRVAMVSTWNSRCGVAEYARNIVVNAAGFEIAEIFSNKGADIVDPSRDAGIIRNWVSVFEPDLSDLEDALKLSDTDIVHIQHNFGFYELGRLAGLIERQLDQRGVVMTLHKTKDADVLGELISLRSIGSTLERVDRLIVHQELDVQTLSEIGLTDNVSLVPLGTPKPPPISVADARHALGLGTRPVIGTFGFLLPHKGTLELLGVLDALRAEFPDICLLALSALHPDPSSEAYERLVWAEIAARGLDDNVVLITDYLAEEVSRVMLRGVDAIVLPYQHTEESASSALRFVLPLERPVIVTDRAIFDDCAEGVFPVDPSDPVFLEDAVRRVLLDVEFREDLARRAASTAHRFRWARAVADHREIYVAARRAHRLRCASEAPLSRY